MSKPAAIQATFADFKIIRGRKIAQLVCEIPIEQADAALSALGGIPNPATETWIAIARLDLSKAREPASNIAIPKEKRRFGELPIAQQAGLLCDREAFWNFLKEEHPMTWNECCRDHDKRVIPGADAAKFCLYELCDITSRAELSTNTRAAGVFQTLLHDFEIWLREPL